MTDDVIWLREVDAGTPNSCMVLCWKGDPGAIPYKRMDEDVDNRQPKALK